MVRLQPAQAVIGPTIAAAKSASGKNPQDRFRRLLPLERIPAHAPLVLLWHGERLSSPDTIIVKSAKKNGHGIEVQIELRRM